MQGHHGSLIHSVKDPPASFLLPKQSMFCRFDTHKLWHHTHHKNTSEEQCSTRAQPQRRRKISCKKSPAEAGLGLQKVDSHNTGSRLKSIRALHMHGRVTSKILADGDEYTRTADSPGNYDLSNMKPLGRYSILSQKSGLHVPLCLKSVGRQQRKMVLRSLTLDMPAPQDSEMAVVKWLKNLGSVYGVSFMLLVGLGYWIQGLRCFPWFAVNFYLKDVLTVDPGTLQIVQNTVNLPMVAKPMYGIVSDAVYIRGAHRVPYLVIGGFLQAISWGTIALLPVGCSSVSVIAILLALSNLGASIVDVANDALVAECASKKKSNGELQSFAWLSTAVGGVLGNLIAAFALSRVDFKLMFSMFGMLLLCQAGKTMGVNERLFDLRTPHMMGTNKRIEGASDFSVLAEKRPIQLLPSTTSGLEASPYALAFEMTENGWRQSRMDVKYMNVNATMENAWRQSSVDVTSAEYASLHLVRSEAVVLQEPAKVAGMMQQLTDLVCLVKQREILYPLSWFMASYAMIPTLAGTMFFFQTQHLNIDPSVVGLSKVMGQVGLMGGSMVYSRYLKHMPLRKLLASIQVLLCMCMMFDMILVKRINLELGIPDAVLVLGGSAFVDAINQFKVLPFTVLLARLCPAGSEGSLLAAFMSVQCLATIISGYMGVNLASILHITSNDFSELPTGIFVQSMAALLPLFWISFIPDGSKTSNSKPRDGKNF